MKKDYHSLQWGIVQSCRLLYRLPAEPSALEDVIQTHTLYLASPEALKTAWSKSPARERAQAQAQATANPHDCRELLVLQSQMRRAVFQMFCEELSAGWEVTK